MKPHLCVAVTGLLSLALLWSVAATPSWAEKKPPSPSTGLIGIGNPGKVTVEGTKPPIGAGPGDRHVAVPVGAIVLVACGEGAAARLRAAGDTDAESDAASCAQWSQQCYSSSKNDPVPQIAEVRLEKFLDGTWGYTGSVCGTPAKPVVTAELVRARVTRLIPVSALGLAPKGSTLINIQTVMWVGAPAEQQLPVVQILGRRVVVHIRVDHVVYDFGDGVSDPRGPAGKAYDRSGDPCRTRLCPDYYGHIYAHRGVFAVTATVQWDASFTVDGGAAQQIPGTVAGPVSSARVRVKEARVVLVPNP